MRYPAADSPYGGNQGPEEAALNGWLEDNGPYVSLSETSDPIGREESDEE